MEILGEFKTVDSLPCLLCESIGAVVLSDLHVGIEIVQAGSGVFMPKFQTKDLLKELKTIRRTTRADTLIINGDTKHYFRANNHREKEEVERFLRKLSMIFKDIIIVKGNHDSAIEVHTESYNNIEVYDEYRDGEFFFIHGHKDVEIPEGVRYVVIGHEHPALELKDDIGIKEKIPAFLFASREDFNVVVLPAYSKVASGTSVNTVPQHQLLCPFLREEGVREMEAIGVDREAGTFKFPKLDLI